MKNIRTLLVIGALAFTASGCENTYYLSLQGTMNIKTHCDDGDCTSGTYRDMQFKELIREVSCRERQLVERTFTMGPASGKLQVCPTYHFTQNEIQQDPRVETAEALTGYRISIPVSKPGAFGNIALDLSNARESQINYTDTKVATCDVLGTNLPRKVFTIDYRNQAIRLAAPADSVTCEFPAPLQQAIVAMPDRG
ncbi:hypothetical protein K2X30_11540 [bacterium]|nr:hypothetical protein [bacterium]